MIEAAGSKAAEPEVIAEFKDSDIVILNGRYGPYIKHAGANYRIPKDVSAGSLTEKDCLSIIADTAPTARKFRKFKKK